MKVSTTVDVRVVVAVEVSVGEVALLAATGETDERPVVTVYVTGR